MEKVDDKYFEWNSYNLENINKKGYNKADSLAKVGPKHVQNQ
jgi:hypothetical protein